MKQLLGIAAVVALTVGAMAAGAGIYKWTMVDATLPVATPSPALSRCESLTQQLAQAETERGAAFLIREWEQKGCAPPTPTPTPTPIPLQTSRMSLGPKPLLTIIPLAVRNKFAGKIEMTRMNVPVCRIFIYKNGVLLPPPE